MSTSGVSPVTVTDSCTDDGTIEMLTTICCPTRISRPVRVNVATPAARGELYEPTRTGNRYLPESSVTVSKLLPDSSCTA